MYTPLAASAAVFCFICARSKGMWEDVASVGSMSTKRTIEQKPAHFEP